MEETLVTVLDNRLLSAGFYEMTLSQEKDHFPRAGMFFSLALPGFFLRRPFSPFASDAASFSFLYKVVGEGTEAMSRIRKGEKLNALLGLGNGYDVTGAKENPLLIGGGSGVGVLLLLARKLIAVGKKPRLAIGFNTGAEVSLQEEFEALGSPFELYTVDGSRGRKGFPTLAMEEPYDFLYACGPLPLLKAVKARARTPGLFSLEARMGCGFGVCMGCTIKTKEGRKRICKDGPVFDMEDLVW